MSRDLSDNLGRALLRLTVGALMLFHGVAKLGNGRSLDWIGGQLADAGLPEFLSYGVFVGEIVGPLMILAGIYCRIGAGFVAVNMLFAIFLAHTADLDSLADSGGWAIELQVFYLLGALAVALLGSGRFAVRPD